MNTLESDPRYRLSVVMQPFVDDIYQRQFNPVAIRRTKGDILDRNYSIDVLLRMETGLLITIQEKIGSFYYSGRKNLTIEYYQNPKTKAPGDWFHMAAQVYFVGFANQDLTGLDSWIMVDWLRMALATKRGLLNWKSSENKDGVNKASFRYLFFKEIPTTCIIASRF